jgi:hypothetical protein
MSLEENMEELLNIEAEVVDEPKPVKVSGEKEDKIEDYEYTRAELYTLISKGQEAVQGALEVAQESGHPRAYEVAVNAMKQVADMTDKLVDLQKKMKDLDAENKKVTNVTNNAMFVGSTTELQKMLKQMGGGKR